MINPGNPTGQLISLEEMIEFLNRAKSLELIIVDESFIDFAGDPIPSLLPLADRFSNLLIVRSMSKHCGVPGLRLGYCYSENLYLLNRLRRFVPTWNVNTLGEYFLSLLPATDTAYHEARRHLISDVRWLYEALKSIPGYQVYPSLACLPQYQQEMQGLLLVEGQDVEPIRFKAEKANFKYLENTHPLKDEIEIRLVRHALRHHLPILGICRGSELVNVVCGGTLYGDVQKEKKSRLAHIDYGHYDTYRHPITIIPGTPLASWYRRKSIRVNSYHHQGIRQLASRFKPMAYAADGLIEAYYDPQAEFTVGLQFHPERMLKEYAGNLRVWKAFAAAVRHTAN